MKNTIRGHASKISFLALALVGVMSFGACSSTKPLENVPTRDTLVWYDGHMLGRWGSLSFEQQLKLIDEVDNPLIRPNYLEDRDDSE
jgi:hypothetical protein